MKITDYHRLLATKYYGQLLNQYGLDALLRRIPAIKSIIYSHKGLALLETRFENILWLKKYSGR